VRKALPAERRIGHPHVFAQRTAAVDGIRLKPQNMFFPFNRPGYLIIEE